MVYSHDSIHDSTLSILLDPGTIYVHSVLWVVVRQSDGVGVFGWTLPWKVAVCIFHLILPQSLMVFDLYTYVYRHVTSLTRPNPHEENNITGEWCNSCMAHPDGYNQCNTCSCPLKRKLLVLLKIATGRKAASMTSCTCHLMLQWIHSCTMLRAVALPLLCYL